MSSSATVPPHYFSPTPSTSAFVPMHAAHLSWASTATGSGHGGVDELPAQTNRRASRAPPVPSKPPAFKRASVGPSGLAARARDAAQPARALLQRLSKAPPPLPPRASLAGPAHDLVRSQTPTSNAQPSSARQNSASFSSSLANKFHAVASRELTLKERLAAGAGIGIEWGRKGKERVTGWQSSGGTRWVPGSSGGTGWTASTSVMHVLGVRAPRKTGMAFGVELATVLKLPTAVREESAKRRDMHDPVQGALAQRFLPAIAARCLEYLDRYGDEEGLYRISGRSQEVAELRALFDAGESIDLLKVEDPHAVSSLFKQWLREIPHSLLSDALAPTVDALLLSSIGYTASSVLGHQLLAPTPKSPPPLGLVAGRCPQPLLDELTDLFAHELPAEYYYLLRAIAYHLGRVSENEHLNKMSLANVRLILSPTLRLSPVMLLILVQERGSLFGEGNVDAKRRMAAEAELEAILEEERSNGFSIRVFRRPSETSTAQDQYVTLPPASPAPSIKTPISDLFLSLPPPSASSTPSMTTSPAPSSPETSDSSTSASPTLPKWHLPRSKGPGFFGSGVDATPRATSNSNRLHAGPNSRNAPIPAPKPKTIVKKESSEFALRNPPSKRKLMSLADFEAALGGHLTRAELVAQADRGRSSDGSGKSTHHVSTKLAPAVAPSLTLPVELEKQTSGGGSWGLLSIEEKMKFFGG